MDRKSQQGDQDEQKRKLQDQSETSSKRLRLENMRNLQVAHDSPSTSKTHPETPDQTGEHQRELFRSAPDSASSSFNTYQKHLRHQDHSQRQATEGQPLASALTELHEPSEQRLDHQPQLEPRERLALALAQSFSRWDQNLKQRGLHRHDLWCNDQNEESDKSLKQVSYLKSSFFAIGHGQFLAEGERVFKGYKRRINQWRWQGEDAYNWDKDVVQPDHRQDYQKWLERYRVSKLEQYQLQRQHKQQQQELYQQRLSEPKEFLQPQQLKQQFRDLLDLHLHQNLDKLVLLQRQWSSEWQELQDTWHKQHNDHSKQDHELLQKLPQHLDDQLKLISDFKERMEVRKGQMRMRMREYLNMDQLLDSQRWLINQSQQLIDKFQQPHESLQQLPGEFKRQNDVFGQQDKEFQKKFAEFYKQVYELYDLDKPIEHFMREPKPENLQEILKHIKQS